MSHFKITEILWHTKTGFKTFYSMHKIASLFNISVRFLIYTSHTSQTDLKKLLN